ncbi:MAG: hypothetical protein RL375_854 [Pseudomonadota bacterium]|jgi:hypothetical protein
MSTHDTTAAVADAATPEAEVIPKGYWKDAKGNLVPVSRVPDIDKARTALVYALAEQAKGVRECLADFKAELFTEIQAFLDKSAADYGKTMRGAAGKGNIQLVSFDGRYKILRSIQDSLVFDERLQVAKAMIDERVHIWSKGSNANIKALINHAFQVDAAGKISVGRILSLKNIKIDDPDWQRAMKAISDSMQVASSKSYVRIYERNEATGEYIPIALDIASL